MVVAEVLVCAAVQIVGSGLRSGIYHHAVTVKLSVIGIGENLELANGLDSERSAGVAGARTVLPEVADVGSVQ